jgi:hypothetical protein
MNYTLRLFIAIVTFTVLFETVGPHIFPYGCVGAFRTGGWTIDGPGGTYGYKEFFFGEVYVSIGPLGEVNLAVIKRVALSLVVAVTAAALVGDCGIRWIPKVKLEPPT